MGRIIDDDIKGASPKRHGAVVPADIRTVSGVKIQANYWPGTTPPKPATIHCCVKNQLRFAVWIEGEELFEQLGILFAIADGIEWPIEIRPAFLFDE
jgi:hypothetical protein